jgi:hypothetical protein
MRNLVIVIIAALIAWFTYTQLKVQKKPDNVVTKYAQGLKSSGEKAEEAKDTANLVIIRSAINQFRGAQGRYPDSMEELLSKGFIDRVPKDVVYDKETGEIK